MINTADVGVYVCMKDAGKLLLLTVTIPGAVRTAYVLWVDYASLVSVDLRYVQVRVYEYHTCTDLRPLVDACPMYNV